MSYEGRSPMKDVARSVVMGAAMISPGLLEACAKKDATPPVRPDPTTEPLASTTDVPTTATTAPSASTTSDPTIAAPPTTTVRPRPDPTMTNMPTRGFSGAARARR